MTLGTAVTFGIGAVLVIATAHADGPAQAGPSDSVEGQILVRFTADADVVALARAVSGSVVRRSAYVNAAVIQVPASTLDQALARLRTLPQIVEATRHAIVRGTDQEDDKEVFSGGQTSKTPMTSSVHEAASFYPWQWYLPAQGIDRAWSSLPTVGASVIVAVLDTGVSQAPSLPENALVAGANFITPGGPTADDNGHGTHMATIVAGRGPIAGVAPGALILPVKVLDHERRGTELSLVDGLYFAASVPGVRVINLSLAFPLGYYPTSLLADAIADASAKGILVVAATGNDGRNQVAYPAALPSVIAVGAAEARGFDSHGVTVAAAAYSNYGSRVDLVAFGGNLDRDFNLDGVRDGILGEQPRDGVIRAYLTAGTSPAAAQVSGAVALLIDAGLPALSARTALHRTARDLVAFETTTTVEFDRRTGAGLIDVGAALQLAREGLAPTPTVDVRVAVALTQDKKKMALASPTAVVQLTDAQGMPIVGVRVWGHFGGAVEVDVSAQTNASGHAVLACPTSVLLEDAFFSFVLDTVIFKDGTIVRPSGAIDVDVASYRLLASIGTGLTTSAIILDTQVAAWQKTGYIDTRYYLPTYTLRPLGTGLTTSALVFTISPAYFATMPIAPQMLVLRSFGTGLTTSAIVLDSYLFRSGISPAWNTSWLTVRNITTGTGLTTSAIIWNGAIYSPLYFSQLGAPFVLLRTYGTGLTTSAIVFNTTLLNPYLYRGNTTYFQPSSLYATSYVDFSETTISQLGFSWPLLNAGYSGASSVGDDGVIQSYDELLYVDGNGGEIDLLDELQGDSNATLPFGEL